MTLVSFLPPCAQFRTQFCSPTEKRVEGAHGEDHGTSRTTGAVETTRSQRSRERTPHKSPNSKPASSRERDLDSISETLDFGAAVRHFHMQRDCFSRGPTSPRSRRRYIIRLSTSATNLFETFIWPTSLNSLVLQCPFFFFFSPIRPCRATSYVTPRSAVIGFAINCG